MELWIRSQDKLTLMKSSYIYVAREEVCAYDENKCWSTIGVYETQERALEVLDEIQNILKPKYILDSSSVKEDGNSWVENGIIYQKYNANAKIEQLDTDVYEMPFN